jgi:hypothetical protein
MAYQQTPPSKMDSTMCCEKAKDCRRPWNHDAEAEKDERWLVIMAFAALAGEATSNVMLKKNIYEYQYIIGLSTTEEANDERGGFTLQYFGVLLIDDDYVFSPVAADAVHREIVLPGQKGRVGGLEQWEPTLPLRCEDHSHLKFRISLRFWRKDGLTANAPAPSPPPPTQAAASAALPQPRSRGHHALPPLDPNTPPIYISTNKWGISWDNRTYQTCSKDPKCPALMSEFTTNPKMGRLYASCRLHR